MKQVLFIFKVGRIKKEGTENETELHVLYKT